MSPLLAAIDIAVSSYAVPQLAAEQALLHGYHVSMIQSFKDKDSAVFFQGRRVRRFEGFAAQARRRLSLLHTATSLANLAGLPSNQLE